MKTLTLTLAASALALAAGFLLTSMLTPTPVHAADEPAASQPETRYRVVFQVTSDTPQAWGGVIRNIDNLREALGEDQVHVEVVGHSGGLGMLTGSNTDTGDEVRRLVDRGVVFLACENTMARKKVTADQLIGGVGTVDAGVAQVIRRQAEGWQYVRSGT